MRRILAVDASEQACSVAIVEYEASSSEQWRCSEQFKVAPREHAKLMLPMVKQVLADAGYGLSQMDAIAFARGPGAFTGLRIAVSAVQGLAFGADLGVVPVSTLMAMAEAAWRNREQKCSIVALDARMGELYIGGYRRTGTLQYQPCLVEQVSTPEEVQLSEVAYEACGVGSGWGGYTDQLSARLATADITLSQIEQAWHCHAQDVGSLAIPAVNAGHCIAPEEALPVYLRDNVAKKRSDNKG